MLILGLFTANYAMLFFLIGFLAVAPLLAFLLNFIIRIDSLKMNVADVCKVGSPFKTDLTPSPEENVFVSEWMAMVYFFFGYMITNAYVIYTNKNIDGTPLTSDNNNSNNTKEFNRKSQVLIGGIALIIILCIIMKFRYESNCEHSSFTAIICMLLGLIIFGAGGVGWYYLLSTFGSNRVSDLFGIANRLLSSTAIINKPNVCVPVP